MVEQVVIKVAVVAEMLLLPLFLKLLPKETNMIVCIVGRGNART